MRLDFACFDKNPHTRRQREEIRQLDIRACLLDWCADNVYDDLERIQRHPPPRLECSLIGSLVASSFCASVGHAASDGGIWPRLVDCFQGKAIGPRLGDRCQHGVYPVGSFAFCDSATFFLDG